MDQVRSGGTRTKRCTASSSSLAAHRSRQRSEAEKRGFELRASEDVAGRRRVGLSWPGRRSHGACSISDGEWEQRDGEERDFVVLSTVRLCCCCTRHKGTRIE